MDEHSCPLEFSSCKFGHMLMPYCLAPPCPPLFHIKDTHTHRVAVRRQHMSLTKTLEEQLCKRPNQRILAAFPPQHRNSWMSHVCVAHRKVYQHQRRLLICSHSLIHTGNRSHSVKAFNNRCLIASSTWLILLHFVNNVRKGISQSDTRVQMSQCLPLCEEWTAGVGVGQVMLMRLLWTYREMHHGKFSGENAS